MDDDSTERDLESQYLAMCQEGEVAVTIIILKGATMTGYIVDFDDKVVLINRVPPSQPTGEVPLNSMVYRHAIQSIMPKAG